VIEGKHAARLGVVEWFRVGDKTSVERGIARLQALGIRHFRTHVSWAEYYGVEGGRAWYDWLLPRLGAAFELLPCLHYTPPAWSETGSCSGPPKRLRDFADFVDLVIDRHGACFDTIELWNEPNNLLDWDWRVDIGWHKFAEMVGAAAYWARQCGKRTVLGGPCPTDLNWIDLMGQRGVLGVMDVIGVHGFPGTWDSEQAGVWTGWETMLDAVRTTATPYNPGLELWVTETGYSTWRRDGLSQARRFLEALAAPADRMYWYALQDLHPSVVIQEGHQFDPRHYHFGLDDAEPKMLGRLLESGVAAVEDALRTACPLAAPAITGIRPVLLTGGAGFIGTNLADRLAGEGEHVLIYDSLARPGVERNLRWLVDRHPAQVSVALCDIRDDTALSDAAAGASAVFHLAAQVAVTSSLVRPFHDFEVNVRATVQLLEALRLRNPDAPLVFASTNKVYGDLADIDLRRERERWVPDDAALRGSGVDERRPLCFHTPYGCSKGAADQYVLDYARSFGLRSAVLRMSCIYGERQLGTEDQGWVAHFLLRALAGETITIYGDGCQVRDVLHVGDAVAAYCAARRRVDRIAGQAFNLGGGPANAISLRQLLAHIERLLGTRINVEFSDWRAGDQRYFVADASAARDALDLAAPLGWREGIARLAVHFGALVPAEMSEEAA
jgi:CDP-paratose 2-epimerase